MMRREAHVLVALRALGMFVGSSFIATLAWAHASGVISGTVTDGEDRPLPGVTITVTSPDIESLRRSAVTDVKGRYEIADLGAGTYSVAAALPGFRPAVKTQRVRDGRREVWLEMEPGELRETLPVPALVPRIVPLSRR